MSTIDFVIRDYKHMMALIHVLHQRKLMPKKNSNFMDKYRMAKFMMKLDYEAWSQSIEINSLVHIAILKTLK